MTSGISAVEIAAKRAARAAKKAQQAQDVTLVDIATQPFLQRTLHRFSDPTPSSISVMTWNILAQTLIRRELFPGSDCMRWAQRNRMINQLLYYSPTIACLQEVDRIDDHAKILKEKYDFVYEKGYETKKHGLCICWKKDAFSCVASAHAKLDELEIEPGRRGLSRKTRNIGLVAAMKRPSDSSGVLVATLHLFWHPRHVYERTRQLALFLKFLRAFQQSREEFSQWPIILAGDFNTQPSELGYWCLATDEEPELEMRAAWEASRVVHETVDQNTEAEAEDGEGAEAEEGKEEQEEGDPDRILAKCRAATPRDGLMTWEETITAFKEAGRGTSLLDRPREAEETFGQRREEQSGRKRLRDHLPGDNEPMYTNFTPLWRCTLDYIFYWSPPPSASAPKVSALLKMPLSSDLEPGLPRLGKSASDHLAILAELEL